MVLPLKESWLLLVYISHLIFPKFPGYVFPLHMLLTYNQLQKKKAFLKILSAPCHVMRAALYESPSLPAYWDDINNTIIVCKSSNRRNGFIKIVTKNSYTRLAFCVESLIHEQDFVIVSDTLKFNLQAESLNVGPIDLQEVSVAREVDLSLINTPFDLDSNITAAAIRNYFKTPKIVYENDLLCVEFVRYVPEFCYSNYKYSNSKYLYFKCNRLTFKTSNSYQCGLCVVGETTFKQSANSQSYIPPTLQSEYNMTLDYMYYLKNNWSSGLDAYAEAIEKSIMPFITLKSSIKLKPAFLIEGNRGSGKRQLILNIARKLGMQQYVVISSDLGGTTYAQTETKIQHTFFKAKLCAPCFLIINNFENFGKNNEGQYDQRISTFFKCRLDYLLTHNTHPLILICISNLKEHVPAELRKCFLHVFNITAPNVLERAAILRFILKSQGTPTSISEEELAEKTHGFVYEDLQALVYHARAKNWNFDRALDFMQSIYSESLGAPKIPKVQWNDVGGLSEIEQEIMRTINLPLKMPHLLKGTGLKRSGILLYGPPGTGKTLVAKAVANECKLCFLSVKGPELLNMYVGQSEKNIREVFELAREASPCIIFFDELDSLAPNRGISGDSGGVMDRVVSQLLAEMDGLDQTATIFIIGATNRPDLIDPALLRPGRFDKLLYVGPCIDLDSKISVLRALTRKFNLDKAVDLRQIVEMCPQNITGADFYGLCSNAWLYAARSVCEKEEVLHASQDVLVTMEDFQESLKNLKPSIKAEDLIYFDNLRKELGVNNKMHI